MLLVRVDLVLIRPFLLSCVNLVVLMLTSIFKLISTRKQRRLVSKQGQPQPTFNGRLDYLAHNCIKVYNFTVLSTVVSKPFRSTGLPQWRKV